MNATEYANSVEGTPEKFSWRHLEKQAFDSYPAIEPLIDAATHTLNNNRHFSCAGALLLLPVYIAPIITAGILLAGSRVDGDPATLLAWAAVFAIAHIVIRIRELVRASRGHEPAGAQETLFTSINVVFCILTTFSAWVYSVGFAPPGIWMYVILFLIMTILSLVSAIIMVRRGRAQSRGQLVFTRTPISALGAAIDDLGQKERESIKQDIAHAVEVLATAGIISEDDRAAAIARDLGGLTAWRWAADQPGGRR